ncbi:MAG TPA: peptide-N-glycosidase F-related protein, partial [Nannocystis sp.]
ILKDEALRAEYDLWFELGIFGVPYAANDEVPGCAGRNDTQLGTLLLYTTSTAEPQQFTTLLPLAISQPFNNYAEGASDMVGLTRKTISFDLPADTAETQLVLITSNHGANQGGEEYIRRQHYVYVDQALVLQYKPGRTSCEPFRVYNTQGNGIYGASPRSDEEWQSFSNWCPGDIIDTRIVPLGPVGAGKHELVIDVPDATFVGAQGDFPFSLYIQAR